MNICIEGNIGSGKSTLLKLINSKKDFFISQLQRNHNLPIKILTFPEPTLEWQYLLTEFYNSYKQNTYFYLQNIIYATLYKREKLIQSEIQNNSNYFVYTFSERNFLSAEKFFINNETNMDYKLLKEIGNLYKKHFTAIDYSYLFLDSSPETCFKRITNRDENISIEYIKSISDKYKKYFNEYPPNYYLYTDNNNINYVDYILEILNSIPPSY